MGFTFGFSQFVQYGVFAVLYYAGGQLMAHYSNPANPVEQ